MTVLTIRPDDELTALYRFSDAEARLLYVGITNSPATRFKQHAADKPWWPSVAEARIEWFTSLAAAREAEALAIREEGPAHNIGLVPALHGQWNRKTDPFAPSWPPPRLPKDQLAPRTLEMRVRNAARRRGLRLVKSRRRDSLALAFGRWWVKRGEETVLGGAETEGATLNEVEQFLNGSPQ